MTFDQAGQVNSPKQKNNYGCFGWVLVWIGIILLLRENWGLAWAALAISIGFIYLVRSIRDKGQEGAILPAVILLISGGAILSQLMGWTEFPMWRLWPLFLGATGLGFVLLWAFRAGGWGSLVIGGFLLFAFGYGFATPSWYRYLRAVRNLFDYWPLILVIVGLMLLVGFRSKRNVESG